MCVKYYRLPFLMFVKSVSSMNGHISEMSMLMIQKQQTLLLIFICTLEYS